MSVTFGERDNFRTEDIVFDVEPFNLPYNAIFGRPMLAKFMAVVDYEYNTLKIPRPSGIISVKVAHCTGKFYVAMVSISADNDECPESTVQPSAKQRITLHSAALTKAAHLRDDHEKMVTIGAQLGEK